MKVPLLLAGVGLLAGSVGYLIGVYDVEAKVRREYEESARIRARAQARSTEKTVVFEADPVVHLEGSPSSTAQIVIPFENNLSANDYHKAMSATETDTDLFVAGGINDYGISYLEEEEYMEEDGRFKGQITIVMEDTQPSFFMNGNQISDWDQRVGDSILVDFHKLVPPGIPPVLYVRNHRTDEDYEVLREIP
jgi:hypothetical protein